MIETTKRIREGEKKKRTKEEDKVDLNLKQIDVGLIEENELKLRNNEDGRQRRYKSRILKIDSRHREQQSRGTVLRHDIFRRQRVLL